MNFITYLTPSGQLRVSLCCVTDSAITPPRRYVVETGWGWESFLQAMKADVNGYIRLFYISEFMRNVLCRSHVCSPCIKCLCLAQAPLSTASTECTAGQMSEAE